MKFLTALTLLGFFCAIYCDFSDPRAEEIFNDVSDGFYDSAIRIALQLNSEDRNDLIIEAVEALFNNSERNLFNYGYRLKNTTQGTDVYSETFPIQVQRILNGRRVKIVNRQNRLPLKLGSNTDSLGDRTAFGDGSNTTSTTIAWEFRTEFDNGRLAFNIFNVRYSQYLKLGVAAGSTGDHIAYGADRVEGSRSIWLLTPVNYENNKLFYIVNRRFSQALKESRTTESNGDRKVYGHNGTYQNDPERFAFYITYYQTQNNGNN